ncbi:MAG: PorV/PorQ family protein [Elusimicrobia bacterium]|nr:PorV/PorQ family protein [Elusimicrobiota bacterium]
MTFYRKTFIFGLALDAAIYASAAPFSEQALGTRGPAVLRQEPGVRAAAMGGAYVALADDATGAYWNPGALQETSGQDIVLSRSDSFSQTYNYLGYTRPVWWAKDRRTVGVSVGNVSYAPVDVVENLEPKGTERPQETVVGFTYAQPLASLSIGGTLKWVNQHADENAQSWAVDAGLFGKMYSGRGSWGVAMQNVGPGINQSGTKTGFPFVLRSGMAWRVFPSEPGGKRGLLLAGELDLPVDDTVRPRAGVEYEVRLKESLRASFRGGWRSTAGNIEEGELALGLGLTAGSARINYAYVPNQTLGATQWVDVGFHFGGVPLQQTERARKMAEAEVLLTEGRLTSAEEKLEELLRLSPRYPPARKQIQEVRRRFDQSVHPETLFILGQRAFAQGNYAEAVDYLSKLMITDPDHRTGKEMLEKAEKEVTRARMERVKKEMAAEKQKERSALIRQAETLSRQAQWRSALPAWRNVLAKDPANTHARAEVARAQTALYDQARSLETSEQFEKATDLYRFLDKDDPGYKDCAEKAERLANQTQVKNLQRAQEKYERGLLLLKENNVAEARRLFQQAVDLAPNNKTFQKALERTQ